MRRTSPRGPEPALARVAAVSAGLALAFATGLTAEASLVRAPSVATCLPGCATASPLISRHFSHTAINGPGYINMVALSPFSNTLLAAGDVSGVQRSPDLGVTFTPSLLGMLTPFSRQTATIAFHPTQAGVVYAGTGEKLTSAGGLYRSTDDGVTWHLISTVPQFAGNNAFGVTGGVSTNIPRATGKLLGIYANSTGRDTIFAGTFNQGLMRSTDGGATWTTLGFAGKYIRGIEFNPAQPSTLYVGVFNSGVWVSRNATAASGVGFSLMAGSPSDPEELAMTGQEIFAAAGAQGLYRYNGSAWSAVNSGVPLGSGVTWMSVRAYAKNAQTIVYAGNNGAPRDTSTGGRINVVRSVDNGTSWQSVTSNTGLIDDHIVGTSSVWEQSVVSPTSMLGQGYYAAQDIEVRTSSTGDWSTDTVFVSGRAGIWRSTDGGTHWQPAVNGLQTSVNRAIAADPTTAGRVYVGNTDFVAFESGDGLATVNDLHPAGAVSTARDFALDTSTTPATVFMATGDRDVNRSGEVFFSANATSSAGWTRTNLAAAAGGHRPLALALGRDTSGRRVVLAAVDTTGVFRYVGNSWSRVSTTAMTIAGTNIAASAVSPDAQMVWPPGTQTVFLFDAAQGIWRSTDAGVTWTLIWRHPSNPALATYLAAEPDLSALFVAADDGLYRLSSPAQGTVGGGITAARIGTARPGPIVLDAQRELWVTQLYTSTTLPQLQVSTNPVAPTPTWQVASDTYYSDVAALPTGLAVAPDGSVYVSLYHDGVLRGT